MRIIQVKDNKEKYLNLLLMTGFGEEKVKQLLEIGELFVLTEDGVIRTVCIVEALKDRSCAMRGIVTVPDERRKGYATNMLQYVCEHYSEAYDTMFIGVHVKSDYIPLYEKCGFEHSWNTTEIMYLKRTLDSIVDVKKVVDMAMEAGRILLKNGAEIFRVEDTIMRICQRFHIEHIDIFTLSHAIFVSAEDSSGEAYTRVKNVPLSSAHLGIVAEVNNLSREITGGYITIEEAVKRLQEIDNMPAEKGYLQMLGAGVASGCLGILLGATLVEGLVSFVIGCILYFWLFFSERARLSKIITNIGGGIVITGLAIIAQQSGLFGVIHLEGIIGGTIMPLVPGVAFVNAIRDVADSDFLSGTVKMINAIMVFVYIAIGVAITLSVCNSLIGGVAI